MSNEKKYKMTLNGHPDQPIFLSTAEVKRHWKRYFATKFVAGVAFEIKQMAARIEPLK